MAPFKLFLDGQTDQVQPGLALVQRVIDAFKHLGRDREGYPLGPKFFSSHGDYFVHTLLTLPVI